jgi:alkanesulfonate monooxygenase SsuD/methylene tetrahydromethanopterin reductase-like flavin-dependent oxidoreductase (luciferase family)
MKFMLHLNPVVPASPEQRERLRPIAHRTEKIQQMLREMVELTQMAEDLGFDIVTYSEHHFYRAFALRENRWRRNIGYSQSATVTKST